MVDNCDWMCCLDTVMSDDVSVGGCRVKTLPKFEDSRGWLVPDVQEEADCTQVYHSVTYAGMARDIDTWHMHRYHLDRFVVLQGKAMFAVSYGGITQRVVLHEHDHAMLYVPSEVYHCFRVVGEEPCMILNVATALYDPEDELRYKFDEVDTEPPWTS